ncbi:MAG: terpene cyclase/mutase family protein [Planctomycetota bacterium]|nr:terpene cyclase/mutase family protein [Planctomycetota bacterium]
MKEYLLALACLMLACAVPAGRARAEEGRVRTAELAPEAEKAIDRGLEFLARTQNTDGSWGNHYTEATTSLSLMAFMLKGNFPGKGKYGEGLDKAVAFLIQRAKDGGGYMGINMYEHGLSTLALSEAWGMTDRKDVRDTLKRAVEVILRAQSPTGGWRYNPRPEDADISVTVMQIMALASAREAGIHVPTQVIDNAVKFVQGLQVRSSGGFGYTGPQQPGFARSAAGVMALLMCGQRDSRAVLVGLEYLRRLPESKFFEERFYYYGHYYAIQAMYQAGESYYQEWYPRIRDALLPQQKPDGSWSGGGEEGDPSYATSMSILILGVPYRFLPIYQR